MQESMQVCLPRGISSVEWQNEEGPLEVHLSKEIDAESVKEFESSFYAAVQSGQSFVPIYINSPGGSLYDAFRIVDLIQGCPIPVHTIARGMAMSAAAMIFCCGERRIVTPHASIMLHTVRTDMLDSSLNEVETDAKEARRLQNAMCQVMAQSTGKMSASWFQKRIERRNVDVYVTPTQALKIGIATEIGYPSTVCKVRVKTSLQVAELKEWEDAEE